MSTPLDTEFARTWVERWDRQQERYVADREERFAVIADVVAGVAPDTVLDLGCGPGSLAARLAGRLPGTRIVGLDNDPLLLGLGRGSYGEQVEFVSGDLAAEHWPAAVPTVLDAAVSSTALHWLAPDQVAALYRRLAGLIRPGGVFVNGDHLPVADEDLRELATSIGEGRAGRAGVRDNEEWGAWWDAVRAEPDLAGLMAQRPPRPDDHGSNRLSVAEHAELLRAAGFRAAAPVWQCGEDHVLVALR